MPSRKRERSTTPEVRWESLPDAPPVVPAGRPDVREKKAARAAEQERTADAPAEARPAGDGTAGVYLEAARALERHAWRSLVVRLAALKGDPQTEALLSEKHPELRQIADICRSSLEGGSLTLADARGAAGKWFERSLRGSNSHGPSVRAGLCDRLRERLRERAAVLRCGVDASKLQAVLEKGDAAEEGPLVCSRLAAELEGSRFEGLWIAREGRGVYSLGDAHEGSGLPKVDSIGATISPCVRVIVKAAGNGLLIDSFFHADEREPVPARVPIGPFLSVYYEGVPLRDAMTKWKSSRKGADSADSVAALIKGLPPGWELRESRSKRGVYYYANPAKGLSQLERPVEE